MSKIGVFAGTTEGREFLEKISLEANEVVVFVATNYGREIFDNKNILVRQGRLNLSEMEEVLKKEKFDYVVDATHPHAKIVTENIKKACEKVELKYIRVERKNIEKNYENVLYFNSIDDVCEYLSRNDEKALIATGSKYLEPYTRINNYKERFYLRVLSTREAVEKATDAGFNGKNLIAMQGPFSVDINYILLKETKAKYFVTKDSGDAGGFKEKVFAAKKASATVLAIKREIEEGISVSEAVRIIDGESTKLNIIGIGPGNKLDLTIRADRAIKNSDILIGAKRMTLMFSELEKKTYSLYKANDIIKVIKKEKGKRISILYSGDVGFHSGSSSLLSELKKENDIEIEVINGLSSISSFASKIKVSYDDADLISLHGERANVAHCLLTKGKVFVFMDYKERIYKVLDELSNLGFTDTKFIAGSRISYNDQIIVEGKVGEKVILPEEFTNLSILYLEGEKKSYKVSSGIFDKDFIRGKTPMTKREVRSIILSSLELRNDDIVIDVGAGSGSVSCEIARLVKDGRVYAIEKDEDAARLIKKNKEKFRVENLHIYTGSALSVLKDINEKPNSAFIGGSSGELLGILETLFKLNSDIKIVISAITPKTIGVSEEFARKNNKNIKFTLVQIARSKKIGSSNLMTGLNPVWIIEMEGEKDEI